jgi:hypothetical protein
MHNHENEIFTACYNALHSLYPDAYITGNYINKPASFPAVSIICVESVTWRKTRDTGHGERHTSPTYEVNVYSNLKDGAKEQAQELLEVIDRQFTDWNFNRLTCTPIENLADNTIFRYVARYRGILDEQGYIYRR